MKKFAIYFFTLYFLMVVIHFATGWILQKGYIPIHSLKNIQKIDIKELQEKKALAIEYIARTNNVYILTQESEFYAINLKDHKVKYKKEFDFIKDFKDMKCIESICMVAQDNKLIEVVLREKNSRKVVAIERAIEKIELYGLGVIVRDIEHNIHQLYYTHAPFKKSDMKRLNKLKIFCGGSDVSTSEHWTSEISDCKKFLKIYVHQHGRTMGFLNLHSIKDIVVDDDAFLSNQDGHNIIFIGRNNLIYQAQTTHSFIAKLNGVLRPFVYFPMLPFLMA